MLVVIDGIDGCGKTTQFNLLCDKLKDKIDFLPLTFPDYKEKSSALVKLYLDGEIAQNAEEINAYAASSFYACDRYISYKKYWEPQYIAEKLILAARYTTSNMIHQLAKLHENEWDTYLDWLYDYEFVKMGLPEPNLVILLDITVETALKLIKNRGKGNDIHENLLYLTKARKAALYVAKKYTWSIISCEENGELKKMVNINLEIEKVLKKFNVRI